MANGKKPPAKTFTSLRIIGEKAQKLLAKAREIQRETPKESTGLPESQAYPEVTVHLSIKSVVKVTFTILAIALGVVLLWLLQDKLVLLILAIFIATIIDPGVRAMKSIGIPRGLAVLVHYFVALFLFIFLVISLIPIIAKQLIDVASLISTEVNTFLAAPHISLPLVPAPVNESLTQLVESTLRSLSINKFADALEQFGQSMSATAQGSFLFIASIAGSVVNFFANLIVILVLAFFMQIEKEKLTGWLRGFLPFRYRSYVDDKSEAIQWKLAQWARGQLILCFCIGFFVFLALVILRMPYALTLGILAGFTEFIPVLGPLFAAIPAVLIALTQEGFFWALILAAVYYVIQWCENNLLVPLIMKRAVGLSPIAILFAMMVGISFPTVVHPILGVILSIPATTVVAIFIEDWRTHRTKKA